MTISTTENTAPYTGNGVTTAFSFPYLFYDQDHLVVMVNGVIKTITTDYTVSGEGSEEGGSVTFLSAPASGAAVVIQRIVPYDQQTDLENFDGNPSDVTEKQFDLNVMQAQQLAEQVERAMLAPVGTSLSSNAISGTISSSAKLLAISTAGPTVTDVTTDEIDSAAEDAAAAEAAAAAAVAAAAAAEAAAGTVNLPSVSGQGNNFLRVLAGETGYEHRTPTQVRGDISAIANVVEDTTPQLGGFLDPNGNYIGSAKGGDIASASPLVIDTDGDYFDVTGTTNFAAMTVAAHRRFALRFTGILTVTHGSGITIPGAANYTTAAGDIFICQSTAADTVQVLAITKADGTPVSGGGRLLDVKFYTASGTWTKPAGCTKVRVRVIGGGGGGYGNSSNGTAGGTSSFGSHASSTGGAGGLVGTSGAGGVGSSTATDKLVIRGGRRNNVTGLIGPAGPFGSQAYLDGTTPPDGFGYGGNGASTGCPGGAGGDVLAFITSGLGATETVTVGAQGSRGGGGDTPPASSGGLGLVIVESYS